jgi:hypothetical protein
MQHYQITASVLDRLAPHPCPPVKRTRGVCRRDVASGLPRSRRKSILAARAECRARMGFRVPLTSPQRTGEPVWSRTWPSGLPIRRSLGLNRTFGSVATGSPKTTDANYARRVMPNRCGFTTSRYRNWARSRHTAGLKIAVTHLPPGTSKWIEHRLFAFITRTGVGNRWSVIRSSSGSSARRAPKQILRCAATSKAISTPKAPRSLNARCRRSTLRVTISAPSGTILSRLTNNLPEAVISWRAP